MDNPLTDIDRQSSRALRDIARLINSSVDLDVTLQHIVDAACRNTIWALSAVMSIDQDSGNALVMVRHDPNLLEASYRNQWTLATSPSLVALTRNEPVIIRDAQTSSEFPGYREEAFQRGYRTVVIVPLGCKDMSGRAMVLSVQSRNIVDLSNADLVFLETIGHLGAIAVDKAHRVTATRVAAERLNSALDAHSSLMQKVLSDGSVASAARMVETFMPNPTIVVDLTANLVVAGRSPAPDAIDDDHWHRAVGGSVNRQLLRIAHDVASNTRPQNGKIYLNCDGHHLNIPAVVEPLMVDSKIVGVLIIFTLNSDFGELDHLLLDSAKFALSVQMMRSYLRFQTESQTVSDLFAEIVKGELRNGDDLAARARRMNIDMEAPASLVAIGLPAGTEKDRQLMQELHPSVVRLAQQQTPPVNVAMLGNVILCRIPVSEKDRVGATKSLVSRVIDEVRWLIGNEPIAVVGRTCSGIHEYGQAWRECERMFHLAIRFNRTGLLTAQDFGPFPLLLSAADGSEVRSFVDVTIGAVANHDSTHGTDYIKTLAAFVEHGCRSQACADAMGLHVTTLRYRLNRIRELFGIEIDSPERRFSLELALRLKEALS